MFGSSHFGSSYAPPHLGVRQFSCLTMTSTRNAGVFPHTTITSERYKYEVDLAEWNRLEFIICVLHRDVTI